MDNPDPRTLSQVALRLAKASAMRAQARQREEYVGTAAEELVTARMAGGELTIELHPTAKRRLEREDLAGAVVEAVHDAERQLSEGATDGFEEDVEALEELTPQVKQVFIDTMRELRSRINR